VNDQRNDRWKFEDRYYMANLASTQETMDLELDDVGPGVGRGPVIYASRDDETELITVRTFTSSPLPIALLQQFINEAQSRLPPQDPT